MTDLYGIPDLNARLPFWSSLEDFERIYYGQGGFSKMAKLISSAYSKDKNTYVS
jgi:hypothetical protein